MLPKNGSRMFYSIGKFHSTSDSIYAACLTNGNIAVLLTRSLRHRARSTPRDFLGIIASGKAKKSWIESLVAPIEKRPKARPCSRVPLKNSRNPLYGLFGSVCQCFKLKSNGLSTRIDGRPVVSIPAKR